MINPSNAGDKKKDSKDKKLTPQEIVEGFRKLRDEQRQIASKITEFEMEKSEHKLVIESLEGLDGDRKCFRLITGILVERTVKEVLPALKRNIEQLSKLVDTLNEQLVTKGKEINEYRDKYNIRIQGEDLPGVAKTTNVETTSSGADGDKEDSPLPSHSGESTAG